MVDLHSIAPIRRPEVQARFVCKYCHRTFVNEDRYLQHECKQMKREAEFKSPVGQAAWHYYQLWMRALNRMPPPGASFVTSKYFRTFINFTNFVRRVDLPNSDRFIKFMVEKQFSPTMWMSDDVYSMYIEYLDRKMSPIDQAKLSIDTLLNIADIRDVDVSGLFDVLDPSEVMHLIRVRKLSPWLLLHSNKFKQFFIHKTNPEQKTIMENLIRPSYWASKFEQYPEAKVQIKKCVEALEI